MFVQSDHFAKHSGKLSFCGQEAKDFTYRLCRLNLFIHGLDGDIRLGSSYDNDQHPDLKADFVIANPPFNDGSKGEKGWGADRIDPKDARLQIGDRRAGLAAKNANYMWMMHFLHHLNDGGTAGYVMANGAMNSNTGEERAAREALADGGFVDCIVQLPEKLFANTGIPCSLWFLSKNRNGNAVYRPRKNEILFIDARKKAKLIEGSRKQKELSESEINEIADTYHHYRRRTGSPENIEGFCKTATLEDVRAAGYALTPGRYVGTGELDDDGEPFEEKMNRLTKELAGQLADSERLGKEIRKNLEVFSYAK
jgi:type I restriction enzyme M protein